MPRLMGRAGVLGASLFTQDKAEDPYVDDGAPPALMVQIHVADVDALDALFADTDIRSLIEAAGPSAKGDALEVLSFPIEGVDDPGFRTAPMSFVVRYFAPVSDEKLFVEYYLENHPPIMADMPGIRNVLCYVPVDWTSSAEIPSSGCILGNEVVFDDLDGLNAALASDVRHRLRDDYKSFPVKPGPNSHYAMQRVDFRP
jgi:uncharacterized protein (TIGR02118 family)